MYVIEDMCREAAELVDRIRRGAEACPRRRWRGPFCRALQVLEAMWRYRDKGEVPLTAEALGLGPRHVPYLLVLQSRFGTSAPFEAAVVAFLDVLDDAQRRQLVMDIAMMAGLLPRPREGPSTASLAVDWDYLKRILCRKVEEVYGPKLGELYEACFQDGVLKSLDARCVALYLLRALDRRAVFRAYDEFASATGLPREAEPVLRAIWEEGLKMARNKGVAHVRAKWLRDVAEDLVVGNAKVDFSAEGRP